MTIKKSIQLMDTTLRDGEQTQGVSFTPAEKLNLAQALLGRLKVDRIEIASAGVSDGEQHAVRQINEWAKENGFLGQVEVLGFTDHMRSVDWILAAGGQVMNLLAKGSLKHCVTQLGIEPQEHIARIKKTIDYARAKNVAVNLYLEDWSNGFVDSPEYVFELVSALKDEGVGHFMLPDTLGVMTPHEVREAIGEMVSRFSNLNFDFHPHNDYGLATANVMAAVEAGAAAVHCTVNCLGERAGNSSLAEVAVVLRDKLNIDLKLDESHIVTVSKMVESFSGKSIACNTPILGSDVFTQTAGIHADGDKKGDLYVTQLSPERFSRQRRYALGKLSGKASLEQNLDALDITLSPQDQAKVLARIIELGDSKQIITPEDLPFIITDVLESKDGARMTLVECKSQSDFHSGSRVDLTLNIDDRHYSETGNGNGAFDAFNDALKKILAEHTHIELPELVDYQVSIPRGGQSNALTEAATTWQMNGDRRMTTRGVSANQVFAAIQATLKMINSELF